VAGLSLACLTGVFSKVAFAENVNVIGVWNLVSVTAEEVRSHKIYPVAGTHPVGHVIYASNGYMSVLGKIPD